MTKLTDHFRAMAANNRWANHRLHTACRQLSADEFTAPRTGFFPSLAETLNHILEVDLYYIDALEGGGKGRGVYAEFVPFTEPEGLAAAQAKADQRLIAYCEALTEDKLTSPVKQDRGERGMMTDPVAALLPHLFQHQIHHRGQAHAMLSSTEVPPPQLDEYFLEIDRGEDIEEALAAGRD